MRILVTRAEPGAGETAARLAAMGHEAIRAPMLAIEHLTTAGDVDGFQAILFTSTNGVAAFAAASGARALPAYCVGDATGAAARGAGFQNVQSADGDVTALAALVAQARRPGDGALLHAAGADVAGDLAGALALRGFTVERRTFYRAVVARTLPEHARAALHSRDVPVDAVLFHSARGASAFTEIVKQHVDCTRITALCFSDAVARAASVLSWRAVHVAQAPHEDALLALVRALPEEN
jgi:uroporphyrinogen-III synthase